MKLNNNRNFMIYKHWHHVRGASSRVVARERERSEGRRSSGRNKNFYQIIPSLGATFRQRGENKTQKQLRHRTKSDFGVHIQPHEEFRTAEQFFPFIPSSIPVRESQFAIPQIPNPFWALILYTYNFGRGKAENKLKTLFFRAIEWLLRRKFIIIIVIRR